MRSYSLSRIDLLNISFIFLSQIAICAFAAIILHPLAGIIAFLFTIGFIPLINDIVAKDMNDPPYTRCDGCGNLRSKDDVYKWEGHTLCSRCNKDSSSQKEFATKFPMWLKRYRKN